MSNNDPLKTYDLEHLRAEQLSINCKWLIDNFDIIHNILCPEKFGTWQERVRQVVETIKAKSCTNNKLRRKKT